MKINNLGENSTIFPTPINEYTKNSTNSASTIPTSIKNSDKPIIKEGKIKETLANPLEKKEAENKVFELLANNGGCNLPCFWNINPSSFSSEYYVSFFNTFAEIGYYKIRITRNSTTEIRVNYLLNPKDHTKPEWLTVDMRAFQIVKTQNGNKEELIYDDLYFLEKTSYYSLENILSTYGIPENIYLNINPSAEMGFFDQLYILLDYSKLGFRINYIMDTNRINSNFSSCPRESQVSLQIKLANDAEFSQIESKYNNKFGEYIPIEKISKYSINEFWKEFMEKDTLKCILVPIENFK
jgi:hypothetical protein